MAKYLPDTTLDLLFGPIDNGNLIVLCEGQPASYAEATTAKGSGGKKLAENALTPGDGLGDFTIADLAPNGRKITIAEQTGFNIGVSGNADHVAVVDTGTSALLLVTTVATQAVTAGNPATIGAFAVKLPDPV